MSPLAPFAKLWNTCILSHIFKSTDPLTRAMKARQPDEYIWRVYVVVNGYRHLVTTHF